MSEITAMLARELERLREEDRLREERLTSLVTHLTQQLEEQSRRDWDLMRQLQRQSHHTHCNSGKSLQQSPRQDEGSFTSGNPGSLRRRRHGVKDGGHGGDPDGMG